MWMAMAMAVRRRIARYIGAATLAHPPSHPNLLNLLSNDYNRHKILQTSLSASASFSLIFHSATSESNLEHNNNLMEEKHYQMEETQWDAIYDVLHQMGSLPGLENALDELDLTLNYPLVKRVLETFAKSEKVAFRFFLWAARQPVYEPTLDAYHASNLLDKLADSGCDLNTSAFNTLIRKYCQFRKAEEALQMCEKMEKLGLYPDNVTYALLIRLFVANLDKVREFMQTMTSRGLIHDAHTLHGFIEALCRRRRFKEACKVLEEMLKNNCKPDVGTYTVLIKGLCSVDRAEDALALFHDMEKRGVVPNIEMFTVLIHRLCKQNKIDSALQLFNQLDEMNIVPKIGTYRIVEKSLNKTGSRRTVGSDVSKGLQPKIKAAYFTLDCLNQFWKNIMDDKAVLRSQSC